MPKKTLFPPKIFIQVVKKEPVPLSHHWIDSTSQIIIHQLWGKLPTRRKHQLVKKGRQGLTIVFIPKTQMRRINFTFRNEKQATDVLSFESPIGLGELLFSWKVISQQARDHNLLPREEWVYLLIHGLLHLLGYDHERSEREAQKMFSLQDTIFADWQKMETRKKKGPKGGGLTCRRRGL